MTLPAAATWAPAAAGPGDNPRLQSPKLLNGF